MSLGTLSLVSEGRAQRWAQMSNWSASKIRFWSHIPHWDQTWSEEFLFRNTRITKKVNILHRTCIRHEWIRLNRESPPMGDISSDVQADGMNSFFEYRASISNITIIPIAGMGLTVFLMIGMRWNLKKVAIIKEKIQ